jgi:hypothetical protein
LSQCARTEIREVDIAVCSIFVPLKHGVDALRELRAAGFIDTTCVDPCVLNILFEGSKTGLFDLDIPLFADYSTVQVGW